MTTHALTGFALYAHDMNVLVSVNIFIIIQEWGLFRKKNYSGKGVFRKRNGIIEESELFRNVPFSELIITPTQKRNRELGRRGLDRD